MLKQEVTLALVFLFALSALATTDQLPLLKAKDASQRIPGEYLVHLSANLTRPLFELQAATLMATVDEVGDGSRLLNAFNSRTDGSFMLLFQLSEKALYMLMMQPEVRFVEENRQNNHQSWMDITISAQLMDIVLKDPSGQWATVQLLRYNEAFYIVLPTGQPSVSTYKCPTRYLHSMSDIVTTWYAIQFDPNTFLVNTGDYTFVKSTGYNAHHKDMGPDAATHVPFATCFGCQSPSLNDGTAVVDLRGTSFKVADDFKYSGYIAFGTWAYSSDSQLVNLTGGGYCGWTAPSKAANDESKACNGGWHLQLSLV